MDHQRTTDSKNRRPGAALMTVRIPSHVEDGAIVTALQGIEFDSHLYDLDDGERGKHMRERFDLSEAVRLGIYTAAEAQKLDELIRRGYNSLDYMAENKLPPTASEA